jgi:hypothetical protein
MTTHRLNFIEPAWGTWDIDEPTGFRSIDFGIKQDSDRLGRDVSYAGSTNKLTLNKNPNHELNRIFAAKDLKGYECIVHYEIDFDGEVEIIGQIDFFNAETDRINYFTFTVLEIGDLSILKRRMETKVDLLSGLDIDLNPITPCPVNNIILPAFPFIKYSKWLGEDVNEDFVSNGQTFAMICPFPRLTQYDIADSLSPFGSYSEFQLDDDSDLEMSIKESVILRAATNIENLKITLKDISLSVLTFGLAGSISTRIVIIWGNGYSTGQFEYEALFVEFGDFNINNQDFEYTIPFLNETDYVAVRITVSQSAPATGGPISSSTINYSGSEMTIEATSVSSTSISQTIRLVDAMKQVVKSISGLNVVAPRWEFGGEFYDQFISNTNFMRLINDRPFTMSLKDIIDDYFPEPFADFQIRKNGDVFIGTYYDFYAQQEIGNFTVGEYKRMGQLSGFEELGNPRYALNRFTLRYDKFQSLKENPAQNTNFEVHGVIDTNIPNKNVNNSKEVNIGWPRSPYSIEDARRKAIDLTQDIATQDDDTVYLIDCIPNTSTKFYTATRLLQHVVIINGRLRLINDSSFSWIQLGIVNGNGFTVDLIAGATGEGTGAYIVLEVSDRILDLQLFSGTVAIERDPINTTFTYQVTTDTAPYIARTNQGFGLILNIPNPDRTPNLRFTVARNMRRYKGVLASTTMYQRDKPITVTDYKNNPSAFTQLIIDLSNINVTEGGNYTPEQSDVIVTPLIYKVPLEITLREYLQLQDDLRLYNGYIRFFNADGLPIKGYIQEGVFKIKTDGEEIDDFRGILQVTLEEKYQPDDINIMDLGNGMILINNEIAPDTFYFDTDGFGKLSIFDGNGKLLYVPVYYNKVRFNNSEYAESVTQLKTWLKQIKNQG